MLAIFKALIILEKQVLEKIRDHIHERAEIPNKVVLLLINRVSQTIHFGKQH